MEMGQGTFPKRESYNNWKMAKSGSHRDRRFGNEIQVRRYDFIFQQCKISQKGDDSAQLVETMES